MNRNKPRDWNIRFMFGCLLVALIIGIFFVKLWMMSVEERLADNLEMHWDGVGTTNSQTNVLYNHENRLRLVERTAWANWDNQF